MHADGHKPGPHHGLGGPHHGPPGQHHGPPGGPHHGPPGPGGLRDRLLGRRGAPAPGVRTDHLGQTILDHEDNLSDKEIYPGHQQGQMAPQTSIPAIGESRGVRQPPPPPSRPRPSHARVRRRGGEHAWARGDRRRTAASLAFLLLTCCRSVLLLITEHLRTLAWQTLTHESYFLSQSSSWEITIKVYLDRSCKE